MAVLHFQNDTLLDATTAAADQTVEYTDVGIGKPLCVQIVNIYTGNAPQKLLGGKPDILVVTGTKSPASYDASQRAINMIKRRVEDFDYLNPDDAFTEGTSIVYYTPILEEGELTFSFELIAEKVSGKAYKQVNGLLKSTANLPLFLTSKTTLLAGSGISNMMQSLGKLIFESSKPFLKDSIKFRIDIGGFRESKPGIKVICSPKDEKKLANKYIPKLKVGLSGDENYYLVNKSTDEIYDGDIPYIIVNIDGKERKKLTNFQPKVASASTLSRFYGEDQDNRAIKTIETSLQLQNDLSYLKKIKQLEKGLKKMDTTSDEYIKCTTLVKAYRKNIQNDELSAAMKKEDEGEQV